jgi:hypothetical protein
MLRTRLTLAPGANGTKKLVERYGKRLVCVRYRYDAERRVRLKTVELIEEESSWTPSSAIYLVKIGYGEAELREEVKRAGASWDRQRKLWIMGAEAVRRLGLQSRVAGWIELE